MTHTPLPWRVGDREPYVEIWGQMRMNAYPIVASMDSAPREANAALIVRAVNSFGPLIAALEDATAFMETVMAERGDGGVSILIKASRNALNSAKKGM